MRLLLLAMTALLFSINVAASDSNTDPNVAWVKPHDIRSIDILKEQAQCRPSDVLTFESDKARFSFDVRSGKVVNVIQNTARRPQHIVSVSFTPHVVPDDTNTYAIFTLEDFTLGVSNITPRFSNETVDNAYFPVAMRCQPTLQEHVIAQHAVIKNTVTVLSQADISRCVDEMNVVPSQQILYSTETGEKRMILSRTINDDYFVSQDMAVDESTLFAKANPFPVKPEGHSKMIKLTCNVRIEGV